MCGIVGGIWRYPRGNEEALIQASMVRLRKRGPDDEGVYFVKKNSCLLGVAQTRLSILDLSSKGHQPMVSHDGRYVIVYNGEVYNYKELGNELRGYGVDFKSSCDTEVVLQAWVQWGEKALSRFEGMYAFAVVDLLNNSVTLARDEFGIKPLYYFHDDERFIFCSELPALLEAKEGNRYVDGQQMYDYLVHWYYGAGEMSFVDGVRSLRGGWLATVKFGDKLIVNKKRWSNLGRVEEVNITKEQAEEEVREEFLRSVRLQLRSDVPIGVALSGGVDSSAVACAIRAIDKNAEIMTFTFDAEAEDLSERKWAEHVINKIDSRSFFVKRSNDTMIRDVDRLIEAQGEPFNGLSIYAQFSMFQEVAQTGVKVLLEGQGADELLAGYDPYVGTRLLGLLRAKNIGAARRLLAGWEARRGKGSKWQLLAHAFRFGAPDGIYRLARTLTGAGLLPPWLNATWFRERSVDFREPRYVLGKKVHPDNALRDHLVANIVERNLPSCLLRQGDRNAMYHSVENRVPFLMPKLARLLLSLPADFIVSPDGETKHIIRRSLKGILPEEIVNRKDKIGFDPPERVWLERSKDYVISTIKNSNISDIVNVNYISDNYDRLVGYNVYFVANNARLIWRIFNAARWMDLFDIRLK